MDCFPFLLYQWECHSVLEPMGSRIIALHWSMACYIAMDDAWIYVCVKKWFLCWRVIAEPLGYTHIESLQLWSLWFAFTRINYSLFLQQFLMLKGFSKQSCYKHFWCWRIHVWNYLQSSCKHHWCWKIYVQLGLSDHWQNHVWHHVAKLALCIMTFSQHQCAMAWIASRVSTFEHYEPPVPSVAAAEWYRVNWKTERWVVWTKYGTRTLWRVITYQSGWMDWFLACARRLWCDHHFVLSLSINGFWN